MPGRFHRFAALVLAAACAVLPLASNADDPPAGGSMRLNFAAPRGWTDAPKPSQRPGVWKSWLVLDNAAVHSLVLSVTREASAAAPYVEATAAGLKSVPGVSNLVSGTATTCGDVPAYTYGYRSERTAGHPLVITHVVVDLGTLGGVGAVLGDVSYAHPPDAADRADALDAMSTLCDERIYAMHPPPGWRSGGIRVADRAGVDGFTSPSGATLIALAVSAPASTAARYLQPTVLTGGATLISDADEPCGPIHVRRAQWRSAGSGGAHVIEQVSGYRHGASYVYVYTRGENVPLDPAAERALTSFCDADATLATPPPRPASPAPGS